jgi:hypothetical protein
MRLSTYGGFVPRLAYRWRQTIAALRFARSIETHLDTVCFGTPDRRPAVSIVHPLAMSIRIPGNL